MSATSSRKRSIFDDSDEEDEEISPSVKENDFKKSKSNSELPSQTSMEPPKTPEKDESTSQEKEKITLSPAQRARIEQKRQQALLIKREKMNRRMPYENKAEKKENTKVIRINDTKLIDTGGGFFIEEEEGVPGITDDDMEAAMKLVTDPAPLFEEDQPNCRDCGEPFNSSFLFQKFDHEVCDQCRDSEDKHCLITKTDAKNEYLLKDVDFDRREPPLKFIVRKNPHNSQWGDMKLYLKLQVEKRALEVWGTEEALEEAFEKKEEQRELNKQKRYNKKMKELRMNVRSSLYTRATKAHEHDYDDEVYLPDEDEYSRTCKTCGHSYTYDKM